MKHLILVGACYLDTILSVPHYPAEDAKQRASRITTRRGGNCPNSLQVLQQLLGPGDGVRPYLVSPLPAKSSPASQRILASFAAAATTGTEDNNDDNNGPVTPVDFRHCLFRETHSEAASSYIIRSEATGSRTLVNYNELPEMTVCEFEAIVRAFANQGSHGDDDDDDLNDSWWWHFEGRIPDITLGCIRLLRNMLPGARISVEVEKPGRPGLIELAAEADVVFYSRTWAENRGYESAEACLMHESEKRPKASLALCTWGADGAAAMVPPRQASSPAGRQLFHCGVLNNTISSVRVVDTVGAGDTFIAAILFGLVCRRDVWDTERVLRFAVNLATAKVRQEGFQGLLAAGKRPESFI